MKNKWILTSNKLPDWFGRYWITIKLGNQYVVKESNYDPQTKQWTGFFDNVIAWQEQPTAYKPCNPHIVSNFGWILSKDKLPTFATKYWVTTHHLFLTTADLFEEFGGNRYWDMDDHKNQKVIAWQEYKIPDPYIPIELKLYLVDFIFTTLVVAAQNKEGVINFCKDKVNMSSNLTKIREIGIANPDIKEGIVEKIIGTY